MNFKLSLLEDPAKPEGASSPGSIQLVGSLCEEGGEERGRSVLVVADMSSKSVSALALRIWAVQMQSAADWLEEKPGTRAGSPTSVGTSRAITLDEDDDTALAKAYRRLVEAETSLGVVLQEQTSAQAEFARALLEARALERGRLSRG